MPVETGRTLAGEKATITVVFFDDLPHDLISRGIAIFVRRSILM
jgi:hypothetical protein